MTPTGTDHVHVPTEVNVRTVSEPAVDDVGVHAAARATSAVENVNALIDATVRRVADRQRRTWARALMLGV